MTHLQQIPRGASFLLVGTHLVLSNPPLQMLLVCVLVKRGAAYPYKDNSVSVYTRHIPMIPTKIWHNNYCDSFRFDRDFSFFVHLNLMQEITYVSYDTTYKRAGPAGCGTFTSSHSMHRAFVRGFQLIFYLLLWKTCALSSCPTFEVCACSTWFLF